MLDKFKNAYQFQKQAREIQKELKRMTFTASSSTGAVTVTANGLQNITEVKLQLDEESAKNVGRLEREITDVTNKVLQKAQKASAEKMKTIMGGMGLPGMGA
jgi:hypothetical protein